MRLLRTRRCVVVLPARQDLGGCANPTARGALKCAAGVPGAGVPPMLGLAGVDGTEVSAFHAGARVRGAGDAAVDLFQRVWRREVHKGH